MPIYAYRCDECGHEFESILKMSDPNPPCPKVQPEPDQVDPYVVCGCPTSKLITGGAFHLKGSGWASDGYS